MIFLGNYFNLSLFIFFVKSFVSTPISKMRSICLSSIGNVQRSSSRSACGRFTTTAGHRNLPHASFAFHVIRNNALTMLYARTGDCNKTHSLMLASASSSCLLYHLPEVVRVRTNRLKERGVNIANLLDAHIQVSSLPVSIFANLRHLVHKVVQRTMEARGVDYHLHCFRQQTLFLFLRGVWSLGRRKTCHSATLQVWSSRTIRRNCHSHLLLYRYPTTPLP